MRSFIGLANRGYNAIYWLATCLFIIASFDAIAGQATLTWDPSSSPSVTSYRLYYGQSSGNYTSNINTGMATSYTVTGLQDGQTYYFAVTATDGSTESDFSNEVSKTIPALAPPNANFSATPTSGTVPLTVNFANTSSGDIASRNWNFGDGSTSTANNPSHTYNTAGTYNVSLTVTGPGGSDSKVMNGLITVSSSSSPPALPKADFNSTSTTGTAPFNVNFTDTSSGEVTSRTLEFCDGSTSTAKN
ncbi:MAG: PKD domain-containing protein [Gammaproteobacteria bacterium]